MKSLIAIEEVQSERKIYIVRLIILGLMIIMASVGRLSQGKTIDAPFQWIIGISIFFFILSILLWKLYLKRGHPVAIKYVFASIDMIYLALILVLLSLKGGSHLKLSITQRPPFLIFFVLNALNGLRFNIRISICYAIMSIVVVFCLSYYDLQRGVIIFYPGIIFRAILLGLTALVSGYIGHRSRLIIEKLEDSLRKVEILENIKLHMSKFVPKEVKDVIESNPDAPLLEKKEEDVSVLFLDIEGYTRMSETINREKINDLVEKYFSAYLEDIHKNNGDIYETAGDGLMIIFRSEDYTKHAVSAVKTAIAICHKTKTINQQLEENSKPVKINTGIHSGPVLLGSTKFDGITGTRWTYTASGEVTNLAARIGSIAKKGAILISEETAKRVETTFTPEKIGEKKFKNIKEPQAVYRVICNR